MNIDFSLGKATVVGGLREAATLLFARSSTMP